MVFIFKIEMPNEEKLLQVENWLANKRVMDRRLTHRTEAIVVSKALESRQNGIC